jgi:probable F420-dependent oxidoreductase
MQHDPIVQAKVVASLDHISGGRFLFGIGGGWFREEMANHGTRYATRWRVLRERIGAMRAIWTQEEAEYHGEFVNFDKIWSEPKPVQQPHPPIVMGGDGPTTFDRIAEYCDGWMPIKRGHTNPVARIPELHEKLRSVGREPSSVPVSIFFAPRDRAELDAMEAAGVSRAIFGLPAADREVILPLLDRIIALKDT